MYLSTFEYKALLRIFKENCCNWLCKRISWPSLQFLIDRPVPPPNVAFQSLISSVWTESWERAWCMLTHKVTRWKKSISGSKKANCVSHITCRSCYSGLRLLFRVNKWYREQLSLWQLFLPLIIFLHLLIPTWWMANTKLKLRKGDTETSVSRWGRAGQHTSWSQAWMLM